MPNTGRRWQDYSPLPAASPEQLLLQVPEQQQQQQRGSMRRRSKSGAGRVTSNIHSPLASGRAAVGDMPPRAMQLWGTCRRGRCAAVGVGGVRGWVSSGGGRWDDFSLNAGWGQSLDLPGRVEGGRVVAAA